MHFGRGGGAVRDVRALRLRFRGERRRRPERSSDWRHAQQSLKKQAHQGCGGTGARQAQRVELCAPPRRAIRQGGAQGPHQPEGDGMQEEP